MVASKDRVLPYLLTDLNNHQVTAAGIALVKTPEDLETPVRIDFAQIFGGNEGASVEIGQVDDVEPSGTL